MGQTQDRGLNARILGIPRFRELRGHGWSGCPPRAFQERSRFLDSTAPTHVRVGCVHCLCSLCMVKERILKRSESTWSCEALLAHVLCHDKASSSATQSQRLNDCVRACVCACACAWACACVDLCECLSAVLICNLVLVAAFDRTTCSALRATRLANVR